MFLAYLKETGAFADLSAGTLLATATMAIAFGVGWGLATDAAAARTDDDALGLPVSTLRILVTGFAIPLGFLAPAPRADDRSCGCGAPESENR